MRRRPHVPDPAVSPLADRIELLRENLRASDEIMREIHAELNLQTAALDRIRAEAERNRALAALHKDEAEAVKQLVEATIHSAQGTTVKQSRRQQWLFFLSGLFLGVPLSIGANFLYDLMK
ncbi:hypothetical protein [Saccharothrix sp. ALI-22-I]|uniref:hypothetical protein n=1 Tax=Saccharothrix sp. ALI-22-I TaxID=1933778 RepID=UPI0015C405AF|nr:hypothetical protein [Saccharothrix sp. ALI-22-I]